AVVEAPIVTETVVEDTVAEEATVTESPTDTAPVAVAPPQPVVAHPEGVLFKHYASAPMTKAPAPDYEPASPSQGHWERPAFDFAGKGSAGGHAAATKATAPATKPQSVE
ncbi:hypothetical protein ACSILD_004013, partial [Yersinia enterocolitica]